MATQDGASAGKRIGPNRELGADGLVLGGLSVSVRDLDRSIRFYRALGFSIGEVFQVLPAYGPLLGLPEGFRARAAYVLRDGVPIELVEATSPPVTASASGGLGAQLGLAHIRFHVDELARATTLVASHGGRVIDDERTIANGMSYVFCVDPDGVRLMISAPT
jgi:catechol 2,3-dioxygenase-like lactoylglutathione lyase family enzyme